MPTYEYECSSCSHHFEKFQNMTDPPLKTCPECGREVRRLIGKGAGVIFKGAGVHSTDYDGDNDRRACSLETTGRTCCGRTIRCDTPGCST